MSKKEFVYRKEGLKLTKPDEIVVEQREDIKALKDELWLYKKALTLAVVDKCKFENALLSTSLGITGGEVAVPKKEQWYLEQAEKEMRSE